MKYIHKITIHTRTSIQFILFYYFNLFNKYRYEMYRIYELLNTNLRFITNNNVESIVIKTNRNSISLTANHI